MLNKALQYLEHGFSIIPVKPDGSKKPYIKWEPYQSKKPTKYEVETWFTHWPDAQIGIITGKISGICVVDIDDPDAQEIWGLLPDPAIIPTSHTPKGLHLYFKCPADPPGNNTRVVPGCDFRGEGGYVVAYGWLPGQSIFEIEPPELPSNYMTFVARRVDIRFPVSPIVEPPVLVEGRRDEDIFSFVNALAKSGWNKERILQYALAFGRACTPPFPPKEVEKCVESALKRDVARKMPLAQEVESYISLQEGYFSLTDIRQNLHILTKPDKDNLDQIVRRLKLAKIIEKYGKRAGIYRRVETDYEVIDLTTPDDAYVDVRYPFELERLILTMPKNIIICAGEPDSGKTSFLLNFAEMNMHKHTIRYLTSEMGKPELRVRISKFNTMPKNWKVEFIPRASNFADLILPNDITLVDYLEISEDFFRVAGMIKEIFDKLDRGIAMIALQKNRGTDLGLGGGRSLEKARLYLSMSPGRIKITKGKNWASEQNPNGLVQGFKLVQGAHFIRLGEWHKEESDATIR